MYQVDLKMYLFTILTKLFHFFPEELAHRLALNGLKIVYFSGLMKIFVRKKSMNGEIQVNSFYRHTFRNKLGIAAGLDKDGEYIDCLSALGVGFIEVGTVTPLPQPGNPKPRLFRNRTEKSLLNRLGFNNKGVEALVANLKKRKSTIPIGVSIGKNFATSNDEAYKDYLFCMEKVYEFSNYIAINISSPNTKGLRELSNDKYLRDLLGIIKDKQDKLSESFDYVPIFIKISPDEKPEDLEKMCKSIADSGIDGIIASNTTAMHNDKNGHGGLSGSPLKNKANEKLSFIKETVGDKVSIIASGGVMSASDYLEKLDAGADLVQIYTGFIFEGPKLIQDILIADSS